LFVSESSDEEQTTTSAVLFVGYVFVYFVCCGFVVKWFVVGLGEWE
jgi:hypothetical protein